MSGTSTVAAAARTRAGRAGPAGSAFGRSPRSIALFAAQALAARRLELTFDEAYYTLWSRGLSFGYLDHPPMVALPHPRLDDALRRFRTRRAGALPPPRRRDARPHRAHRLAAVPLGGNGRARGADVDRDAAGPRRRGLRHPRRAAGRVLDPRPCGARRALADRPGALADRDRRWRSGSRCNRSSPPPFSPPGVALALVATPSLRRWLVSPALFAGPRRRGGDFRALRRLERRAWLGDLRQAARTRAAARICALLYRSSSSLRRSASSTRWSSPRLSPRSRPSPGERRSRPARATKRGASSSARSRRRRSISSSTRSTTASQGNWLAPLYPAAAILAADWVAEVAAPGASGLSARSPRPRCGPRRSGSPSWRWLSLRAMTGAVAARAAPIRRRGSKAFASSPAISTPRRAPKTRPTS